MIRLPCEETFTSESKSNNFKAISTYFSVIFLYGMYILWRLSDIDEGVHNECVFLVSKTRDTKADNQSY